jgi:heat shock protein HslJ
VDWRLINLRATPVEPAPAGTRAPQLRLIPEGARVTGYTGVNDFNGSYQLSRQLASIQPAGDDQAVGLAAADAPGGELR